jgi:hypothetical protein
VTQTVARHGQQEVTGQNEKPRRSEVFLTPAKICDHPEDGSQLALDLIAGSPGDNSI